MSKARLVITAVVIEGRTQAEVARDYGVSKGWVSKLVARYRDEGDAAFKPRSRRPRTSPSAHAAETVALIIEVRNRLVDEGLDAGPATIAWHLEHHHKTAVSRSSIHRHLTAAGLTPSALVLASRPSNPETASAIGSQPWRGGEGIQGVKAASPCWHRSRPWRSCRAVARATLVATAVGAGSRSGGSRATFRPARPTSSA